MALEARELVQVLLLGLVGFAAVNLLVNLVLLGILKTRDDLKLPALYWALVLAVVLVQAGWGRSEWLIVLAFSTGVFPVLVMNVLAYQLIAGKSPWKFYLAAWPPVVALILLLGRSGLGFTVVALPASLLLAIPQFVGAGRMLITDRGRGTPLRKLFGVLLLIQGLYFIGFAFPTRVPGTLPGGWMAAYLMFALSGTVLPFIARQKAGLEEQTALERRVKERMQALESSLEKNRNLVKILLHDITNPIAAMGLYLSALGGKMPSPAVLERLKTAHDAVKSIVDNVGVIYREQKPDSFMTTACMEDCYRDMSVIFEPALERKKVGLARQFELSPNLLFRMDKTLFTHSILGNLVSNALKFSPPDSVIRIAAREDGGRLVLSVADSGIGIPPELLRQLESAPSAVVSRPGTTGDQGMGLGLSSVRSVVATYGGSMTISSRDSASHPQDHGTCVTVAFDTLTAGERRNPSAPYLA